MANRWWFGSVALVWLWGASAPANAGDWERSNNPADIAAQAEIDLKATPKSVRAALAMVHLYNGYALVQQKALGGAAVPDIRDPVKANLWKARIIEACKDPTTLHCGNDITFRADGTISSFGLMDVLGMGDGKGGDSGIPRTNGFFQPITLRYVDGLRTLKATATMCGVQGLGLGQEQPGPKKITDNWVKPLDAFRKTTGAEANFVVQCVLGRPFFDKGKDGRIIEFSHRGQKLHVRGKNYVASQVMWRLDPDHFFLFAVVPDKPAR